MTAYTETIGSESSSVSRTFDAANRLQTATDSEQGTTSYYFDNNGNLTQILPPGVNPGEAGEQLYSFNQRNLLAEYRVGAGSSVYDTIAEYVYDGDGNRVQQIDHSGSQPVTTTYTNDNSGLSQVLVSDNGATQTANLFGLSLIHQDDGTTVRALLADGLGSVRVEMAGNAIDSAATYEPYGKLLARTGDSGAVYGYTGEQHDAATGLVYLRARYYNPNLKIFMSRDPFPGWPTLPASQHGYSYVHNNPVNLIDPTGEFAIALSAPVLVVGGVVIVGFVAASIYYALTPNPPAIPMPSWWPNDWYLYPGKWLYDAYMAACTTAIATSEAERLAGAYVNTLPDPRENLVDVLPGPRFTPPNDNNIRIYVTYMKFNAQTRLTYSGRTSGLGDSTKPIEPQAIEIVRVRDMNHHKTVEGYGAALLDVYAIGRAVDFANRNLDPAYFAIRGREQQLVDHFGGAWSDTGQPYKTGNENRAVSRNHPHGRLYHEIANQYFGELHEYTGN